MLYVNLSSLNISIKWSFVSLIILSQIIVVKSPHATKVNTSVQKNRKKHIMDLIAYWGIQILKGYLSNKTQLVHKNLAS